MKKKKQVGGWDDNEKKSAMMMEWLREMSDGLGYWAIPAYVGVHTLTLALLVFRSSGSAVEWVQKNKYFHILSRGVERDGWKFVLLARFSPVPSYVINYALAATKVGFLVDFLLPTVIGCVPMILQNTSIGSLASAAVASASGSKRSQLWSYLFPLLGISSSILISLRIKKYSNDITVSDDSAIADKSTQRLSNRKTIKVGVQLFYKDWKRL
ncbi:hypothetical protein BUALT_Bualt17G0005800 [Buddleja alternifolia]|uniref:VTT domain-containing protein n=1 Tax=Buddleja alternifolia TaxID=168488 RepID=A0AAV6WDM1_9LAMI|nr:hypothetical protein BUALT_Bualt17G0005800 [Buddleja alternifolia]